MEAFKINTLPAALETKGQAASPCWVFFVLEIMTDFSNWPFWATCWCFFLPCFQFPLLCFKFTNQEWSQAALGPQPCCVAPGEWGVLCDFQVLGVMTFIFSMFLGGFCQRASCIRNKNREAGSNHNIGSQYSEGDTEQVSGGWSLPPSFSEVSWLFLRLSACPWKAYRIDWIHRKNRYCITLTLPTHGHAYLLLYSGHL